MSFETRDLKPRNNIIDSGSEMESQNGTFQNGQNKTAELILRRSFEKKIDPTRYRLRKL